ncbi:MAG: N-acetylmuramoyl-L-alanine amidase [Deltaproteobacteria bacterium]|nr:N-acetylmuramoyl-L-alanine amidase [Deltaproteobacteria bacterium]
MTREPPHARRLPAPWRAFVLSVFVGLGPVPAFPAADTAAASFALAARAERALPAHASDSARRAAADRFVEVADRFPEAPQAREALLRAARTLAPRNDTVSVDAARATVEIRKRFARDYPADPRAPETLLAAAEVERARLVDPRSARATLSELIVRFPTSPTAKTALARLTALGDSSGPGSLHESAPGRALTAGQPTESAPRITRIRSWSGVGGAQLVLDLDREVTASGEWDPNDIAPGDGHLFRVTVPEARPAADLELPDVASNRWVERLTVLERASGGVRVELRVNERLEHQAFSLGNRVVITLAPTASARAMGPVIVDPGHGGRDPGARSAGGVWEKDLTLAIGRRFADRLTAAGLPVVLTRDQDDYVPLEERTAIANTRGGSVLVSIHANASAAPDAQGIETYFLAPTRDVRSLQAASRRTGGARRRPGAATTCRR